MYAHLNIERGTPSSSVFDPVTKKNIFHTKLQLQVMVQQWQTIFSMHQDAPPDWDAFLCSYGQYFSPATRAPTDIPAAEVLFRRAQNAAGLIAAGSDGWKPFELKALPLEAWVHRRRILELASIIGRYPTS